ncbi:MAG: glycine cleavage system protein GcvH [Deltaproteobacteria bacterium]|nr:glycine cleavage system protein GcvH [Deltaproteobacteria bacterium]MBW2307694.1 glycine cleavage system protein GcvH [Deltaproteobacteria bacterium]
MEFPDDFLYSVEHTWVKMEGKVATIGITEYALEDLGNILSVELPSEGEEVIQYEVFGSLESVQTVTELLSPVSGEILEVNEDLAVEPEIINGDPYHRGWMLVIKIADPEETRELKTATEYERYVNEHKKN